MPVQFGFSPVAVYFGRVFVLGPRSRTLAAGFLNAELADSCCRFQPLPFLPFPCFGFFDWLWSASIAKKSGPGGRPRRASRWKGSQSTAPQPISSKDCRLGQRESIGLGGDVAIGKISCQSGFSVGLAVCLGLKKLKSLGGNPRKKRQSRALRT